MFDPKNVSEKYIARYYIVEELASSSSSRIFLAKQNPSLLLPLVVKLFYSVRIDTLQEEARFLAEIRLHRQLQHPFILPIMDSGVDKRTPYIAMPYLPSGSLYDRMLRRLVDPFSMENTLTILSQIGQALHYAHQNHIFHGNLKPRNILFHEDGYVQLSDLTCNTIQGNCHANPDSMLYMAPEQLTGNTNALSDQYALGCLAYELFTSRTFLRSSFPNKQQKEAAPILHNPLLPTYIEQAILKATAMKPAQRYPNILAFINAMAAPTHTTAQASPAVFPIPFYVSAQDKASSPTLLDKATNEETPLTIPAKLESSTMQPEQDTLELFLLENDVQPPSLVAGTSISKQDTLKLFLPENDAQPPSLVAGTTISKQVTIPQTPVLAASNHKTVIIPSVRQKKRGRRKPLLLLISSVIVIIVIWNLIPSLQFLAYPTQSSTLHVTATIVVQPRATNTAMQPPASTSTAGNHATMPTVTAPTSATPLPSKANATPSTQAPTPPTTTFTPPTNPPTSLMTTKQFQVSPTHFTTSNCVPDNNNYRCTAMLLLGHQFQGQLSWQASSTGITANFSTPNGILVAGQTAQVIIYIPAICPSNGTLNFGGSGIIASAIWSC